MRTWTRGPFAAAVAAVTGLGLLATDWAWPVDLFLYDRFTAAMSRPASSDVVIVAIDDDSLAQLGRWPWPRSIHADLVDTLTEAGARAIVFDIAFSEPSTADDDERFAAAIRRSGRVVLPVVFEAGPAGAPVEALPIPPLASAAAAMGHVEVNPGRDGTSRGAYLRAGVGRPYWPFLPLAATEPPRIASSRLLHEQGETRPPASLGWERAERVGMPFPQEPGRYRTLPYAAVLRGQHPLEGVRGATVFVGTTAAGLAGSHIELAQDATHIPGVELMAAAFDAIRHGQTTTDTGRTTTVVLTLLSVGAAIAITLWRWGTGLGLALGLLLPLGIAAALMAGWHAWFAPSAAMVASAVGLAAHRWLGRDVRPGQPRAAASGTVDEALVTIDANEGVEYLDPTAAPWSGMRVAEARDTPASAVHDPLTGLATRALLRGHLAQAVAAVRGTGKQGAVLVLDVERLRDINMTLGRSSGDELLKEVASRLGRATAGRGIAGRLSGGEFAVVYEEVRLDDDICALGNRILATFANPFRVGESEVRVNLRIGVSVFPSDGEDPDGLLAGADAAMRADGATGEPSVRVYDRAMSQLSRDRVLLTRALEVALQERRLSLVFQPIVDLTTGALIGVEGLTRWKDDVHGVVPPSTFVPLAEETGLIGALGEWTMVEACQQARRWDAEGAPPLWVSVNVSPRQFLLPNFEESVRRTVATTGLPASRLMLEVTESAMQDVDQAVSILGHLKDAGVMVALDDFGVGYSSLSHLSQLPVDVVKIDRSFVSGVDVDGPDRTICLAVLALGESLNRRVVAEGVETGTQAEFLRSKGCKEAQGFYMGVPVDAAQIAMLARRGSLLGLVAQQALPFH